MASLALEGRANEMMDDDANGKLRALPAGPGRSRLPQRRAPGQVPSGTGASLLCLCAWCRRTRDEAGAWRQAEGAPAEKATRVTVTHGICPECAAILKSQSFDRVQATAS